MLRGLGRMVWSQTRDMNVLNYPKAIVYEIYTNNGGYTYIKYCKETQKTTVEDERPSLASEIHTIPAIQKLEGREGRQKT